MTAILGISAFYHDSAAALVVDGRIVAAAQEERFSRRKHDERFPERAVAYCLAEAGLAASDLDYAAFYDKPLVKFERLLETWLAFAPRGYRAFCRALPTWLKDKLHLRRELRRRLGRRPTLVFADHHESHAASAFFPSPFDEAAILTLDGVGEWTTAAIGNGSGSHLALTHHLQFPHSLGLLYSAFTYYCGFKVNSGEYKLMGLAPYGRPVYKDLILARLIDLKPDGSHWLDMQYFDYGHGLTMTNARFHRLFGGPPRAPESNLEARHADLAASIQAVTEEAVLRMARAAHEHAGMKNLVLAGGVALNCVANGRLLREGPFERVWIQPAAGDAGGALGAALFTWHHLLDKPRTPAPADGQQGSFLGPAFADDRIERLLREQGVEFRSFPNDQALHAYAAELLDAGNILGWFQGRMEFGPRALGARSILADARSPHMQARLNVKIKFREGFRPFAPCVLAEHAHEWFDVPPGLASPYMLLAAPVHASRRASISPADERTMREDPDLCRRVNVPRSTIPAVTHVDNSARLQTVDAPRNPALHGLLTAFWRRTGCPVLVNTSFNVRGEPMVCEPLDAWRCFLATDMDALAIGRHVVEKSRVSSAAVEAARQSRRTVAGGD